MSRKRLLWVILLLAICGLGWAGSRAMHRSALNHDLLMASAQGDPFVVRELLAQGADPNTKGDTAESSWQRFLSFFLRPQGFDTSTYPLCQAVGSDLSDRSHFEIVQLLLEHHANPNVLMRDGTPLTRHLLKNVPGESILTLLLQHGANPDMTDRQGSSLLMYAQHTRKSSSTRVLLEHGAKPDLADAEGNVPLMWAVYHGDEKPVALLLARGADVNHKNKQGQTALLCALAFRTTSEKMTEMLLEAGADVNAPDSQGCSPFLYALYLKSPASARMLAKGADVRKAIPLSTPYLNFNVQFQTDGAIESSNTLLTPSPGATPLMLAVRCNDPALVKAILAKGADVNARDAKGKTALTYGDHNARISALLQHAGARP